MSVTVRKLFARADMKYGAKLLAGKEGLNRLVEWVHIVEDGEVASFLHGQEIVFSAGLLCGGDEWLMNFINLLYKSDVSAVVLNYGPYIDKVPEEIIAFCDEKKLPLYMIPWKTRMVDMTRGFCQKIIENNTNELNTVSIFKDILFGVASEEDIASLERLGYRQSFRYNFVCIALDTEYGTDKYQYDMNTIKRIAERIAKEFREMYISFTYQEKLFLTLMEYEEEEIQSYMDCLFKELSRFKLLSKVNISVGENVDGLLQQKRNFENTLQANELAMRRKERIIYYGDLGIDKIILGVKYDAILVDYYNETVGKLQSYDEENDTNLVEFMRKYLECDGSPQAISEAMYIHRNTVNNHLRKVLKIIGAQSLGLEEKMKLYVGYHILEII